MNILNHSSEHSYESYNMIGKLRSNVSYNQLTEYYERLKLLHKSL